MRILAATSPQTGEDLSGPSYAQYSRHMTSGVSAGNFDGIPFADLPLETVLCGSVAAMHLRRSQRIPTDADVECSWAIEAALDPRAVIDDGRSQSGMTIRVTGYSPSGRCWIAVTLLSDTHPPTGVWHIATAWITNRIEGHEDDE